MLHAHTYKVEVRDIISIRPDLTRRFVSLRHARIHARRLRENGLPAVITYLGRPQPLADSGANIRIAA